ncbi:acyl-CoA dehydrogenase [Streptomyces inusitatus]|uniref:Acyl-CoA dehydrogenase n=1 Tax=Streptomyces inusitatus TaxID=68221 RepID=A0A918QIY6_9ACTN|nr:acyl-CoA dehydrogenase family protein [Streptomyces inusitatus]GGZ48859.1 acyl-CoA dehydrogenase [Streptomyces inusitatus]
MATDTPSRTELVRRAAELVPLLQKNAPTAEEDRSLPEDTVAALADSGLLKMRVPVQHGGYESDMRTVVEVLAELGRGCGSTSWTAAVWAVSTWMVGLFPDEVQEEVFATPDVRISGILSPSAMAVPTEGGIVLNGRWAFNTGVRLSSWNTNAAVLAHPDGSFEPIMTLLPVADLGVIDDWHTSGLRGSGSVTTVAENLFVPTERVLPLGPALQGHHLSRRNAGRTIYRAPFLPTAVATVSGPALGLAKAARDAFFERLPGRGISYTSYEKQSDAPLTHLQVAEATVKIDEAEFHAYAAADLLDAKGASGEEWTMEERARARLRVGAVCSRAKEAVDILNTASGGSSIYHSVPIQRIERDIQTVNMHSIMHPNTNLELYGRVLCGLEPNTQYI